MTSSFRISNHPTLSHRFFAPVRWLRVVLLILCCASVVGMPVAHAAAAFDTPAPVAAAAIYPVAPRYADIIALTLTVTGGAAIPTGSVVYTVDTGSAMTATLTGGAARVSLGRLAPGNHTVKYQYGGDGAYGSSGLQTLSITVADLPFALTGARRLINGGVDFGYYSAFDKDGNLYTSETNNNILTKYDTAGNLTTVPSSGLSSPRGIVFDLSGNFYVADAGNNRIVEFAPNGSGFTQSILNITGLSNPYTLAFNSATTVLYIADRNNNRIVTYNLATQVLTPVATGELITGIAADPAGNLYFGELYGGLHKLDAQGNVTDLFYTDGQPSGLACDAAGNLYFSDSYTNALVRYDTQGHLLQVGSINSAGIAIDKRGHLFFPEGSQLYEFVPGLSAEFGNISAGYIYNYGSTPTSYLSFQVPYNTSISTITVPTAGTGFSPGGPNCSGNGKSYCDSSFDFYPIYPGRGTGYAHTTLSTGATLDTLLYGIGNNPAVGFSPGAQSTQTPGLTTPAGVTLDTLRVPYVSDSGANTVFKVPATGSPVAIPFTGLNKPTQIAVDGAFSVYVLDSGNNRIVKVDSAGNQTVPFQLGQQAALTSLSAFFVDGAGTLFLSGNSGAAAAIYSLDLSDNYTAVQTGITLPTVLLVDGFGNVFSGEGSTGILREFDSMGHNTVIANNLPGISSLTEEPSGVFDVTQAGVATVTAVHLDGTLTTVPITGLTLPVSVAVSAKADLFVLDASTLQLTTVVRFQDTVFAYGNVQVGSTKTIAQMLFNYGNLPVKYNDTLPGDTTFVAGTSNQCAQPGLAVGDFCNFIFTFKPTNVQDYDEIGYVPTNIGGAGYIFTNYRVEFTGTGIAAFPTAVASPTSVAFGNVNLGSTSPSQVVTLANTGAGPLTINSVALSGSSVITQQSTTCGSTLGAGGTCTVTLAFTPTARAAATATLTFTDNSSTGATQTVAVTGTGVAPLVAISPASVAFPDTRNGSTSSSQNLTVTNSGNASANFSGITLAGADPTSFSLINACGATLAPNVSCTLTVTFTPNAVRAFSATINVASDDPASPATSHLTGNGITAGKLSIAPVTQTFPSTAVGATSVVQTSILSNTTSQAIYLSSGTLTDASDFAQSDNCNGLLAAGGSCTVSFTFTPKSAGAPGSTYAIHDLNAPGTPLNVFLSGNGTAAAAPVALLTPTTLAFTANAGSTSAAQNVTLSNTGNAALTISSIALAGVNPSLFTQSTTCGSTLAAGANCTITITFTPGTTGSFAATLVVTDNSGSTGTTTTTQTAALSGNGTAAPTPVATLTPASLTFTANAGSVSTAQIVTLANTGNAPLAISAIALGGTNPTLFTQTTTCGVTLAAGASCTFTITFKPGATGTFTSNLIVTDNSGSPSTTTTTQSAALIGNATAAPTPVATLTPASLNFTAIAGSASTAQTATLSNTGNAALTISSIALAGANSTLFTQTTTCGATLTAGASCTIAVTFKPGAAGNFTASLVATDNSGATDATTTTQMSALSGTGTAISAPQAILTPTSVNFGSVSLGGSSTAQIFTLSNPGSASLAITSIGFTGANASAFSIGSNTCGTSLAAGASCTFPVSLLTAVAGSDTATLTVIDAVGTQTSLLTATIVPVTPPDFTLTATQAAQSSYRGRSVTYTLQLTSLLASNAFTNTAILSVTGLPVGATASFAPASVVPGASSPATTVLTVAIPALTAETTPPRWPHSVPLGVGLAAMLLGFRLPGAKRRRAPRLLSLVLLIALAASITGCGTGAGFGVPTSTSDLVVTATSGATTHSTTVTLTIQ